MQDSNWIKGLQGQSPYAQALNMAKQLPRGGIPQGQPTPDPMALARQQMDSMMPKRPMMLGQGDNYAPWIHDQMARQAMLEHEMQRGGARIPQGAMGNMGMAQGNPDNYFPEARMNLPLGRSPSSMLNPTGDNIMIPKSIVNNRSQTLSPGIRKDGSRIDYSQKTAPRPMNDKKVKDIKR